MKESKGRKKTKAAKTNASKPSLKGLVLPNAKAKPGA
jgi:hypothetical protein